MGRLIFFFIICAVCFMPISAIASQPCNADPAFTALDFSGEVYGQKAFVQKAGPLELRLEPAQYGWQIKVTKTPGGSDMAVKTPPIRMVETNPRFISGWHFRNKANTGPNQGDVNAPQSLRKFVFGKLATDPALNPKLIVPGAPHNAATVQPNAGDYGTGEIIIEDYGLADLQPGQKARMVYLKFSGCLGWVRGYQNVTLADTADPGVPDIAVERMTDCGLNPGTFKLSDRMTKGREGGQRAYLELELDGDGIKDFVTPIAKIGDDAPGLAMCLSRNNRLITAGYKGRIGKHLDPEYFGTADYWSTHTGTISQGIAVNAPPKALGDAILLGQESASSVLVYLDKNLKVSSYWQGD